MIKELKKFVFRGNVLDLAVGVVIGSAFTGIVNSLVNNIIMPFVGVLTAGINFIDIKINLSSISKLLGNKNPDPTYMSIGLFINSIVEFLIIATTIFFVVKAINVGREKLDKLSKDKKKTEKPAESEEVKVLKEIKNLLKQSKK